MTLSASTALELDAGMMLEWLAEGTALEPDASTTLERLACRRELALSELVDAPTSAQAPGRGRASTAGGASGEALHRRAPQMASHWRHGVAERSFLDELC